jgi:hypothetical protein
LGGGCRTMNDTFEITNAVHVTDEKNGCDPYIDAIIDGVQMSVPLDPANRHYAEIMRQVEAGELTIQEASE